MTKWKYRMNVSGFYRNDMLTIQEKGNRMSSSIAQLCTKIDDSDIKDEFEELMPMFDNITGCEDLDLTEVEEFDECMAQLYDLGDSFRVLITTY